MPVEQATPAPLSESRPTSPDVAPPAPRSETTALPAPRTGEAREAEKELNDSEKEAIREMVTAPVVRIGLGGAALNPDNPVSRDDAKKFADKKVGDLPSQELGQASLDSRHAYWERQIGQPEPEQTEQPSESEQTDGKPWHRKVTKVWTQYREEVDKSFPATAGAKKRKARREHNRDVDTFNARNERWNHNFKGWLDAHDLNATENANLRQALKNFGINPSEQDNKIDSTQLEEFRKNHFKKYAGKGKEKELIDNFAKTIVEDCTTLKAANDRLKDENVQKLFRLLGVDGVDKVGVEFANARAVLQIKEEQTDQHIKNHYKKALGERVDELAGQPEGYNIPNGEVRDAFKGFSNKITEEKEAKHRAEESAKQEQKNRIKEQIEAAKAASVIPTNIHTKIRDIEDYLRHQRFSGKITDKEYNDSLAEQKRQLIAQAITNGELSAIPEGERTPEKILEILDNASLSWDNSDDFRVALEILRNGSTHNNDDISDWVVHESAHAARAKDYHPKYIINLSKNNDGVYIVHPSTTWDPITDKNLEEDIVSAPGIDPQPRANSRIGMSTHDLTAFGLYDIANQTYDPAIKAAREFMTTTDTAVRDNIEQYITALASSQNINKDLARRQLCLTIARDNKRTGKTLTDLTKLGENPS